SSGSTKSPSRRRSPGSGKSRIAVGRRHLGLDIRVMGSVLRLSSAPLAGYTIGFRILMFAILPALGISVRHGREPVAERRRRHEDATLINVFGLSAAGVILRPC